MEPFDGDQTSRQVQASLSDLSTHKLFRLFESLTSLGYSTFDLFEVSSPGATDVLRAWAASRNLVVTERIITPPGAPGLVMLKVRMPSPSGGDGVQVAVTRNVEAA